MPIISLDDIRQEFSISPTQDNSKVITEGLNRAKALAASDLVSDFVSEVPKKVLLYLKR